MKEQDINIYEIAKVLKEYDIRLEEVDDKSIENVLNTMLSNNEILRVEVERTEIVDENSIFSEIDNVIEYLNKLKEKGYTKIRQDWCGYEDNYFVAVKMAEETDDEYYRRLAESAYSHIEKVKKEKELMKKKKNEKRIKQLEDELRRLKNGDC